MILDDGLEADASIAFWFDAFIILPEELGDDAEASWFNEIADEQDEFAISLLDEDKRMDWFE